MRRALLALLLLSGCANDVQTTSGAAYLAARPEFDARTGTEMDRAVAAAANVEPLLRFPARIGLARIRNGDISTIPPREADAWIAFGRANGQYGTFVPISPLVAELTAGPAYDASGARAARSVIDRVRLGAARQQVDAVLVYTAASQTQDNSSPLSLLDLTIIGAYLVPSRSVGGEATASALLLDVRNGYPYGTATATSRETGFVPSVGSGRRSSDLASDAEVAAVGKLTTEVDAMMRRLQTELANRPLPAAAPATPARPAPARPRVRPAR